MNYLRFSKALSLFKVLKVTDIILGCASFGSKSSKSMECNENDGGSISRTFFMQLNVCIVEVKFESDDDPAAIISGTQMNERRMILFRIAMHHSNQK